MSWDALGTVGIGVGAGGRLAICVGWAAEDVGDGVYVLSGESVAGGDIVGGGIASGPVTSWDALGTVGIGVGAGGRLAICVGWAAEDVGDGVYVLSG